MKTKGIPLRRLVRFAYNWRKARFFIHSFTKTQVTMRRVVLFFLVFPLLSQLSACGQNGNGTGTGQEEPARRAPLTTESEKLSYALGLEIGATLGELQTEIDTTALSRGLDDGITGREPQLSPEEAEEVKLAFLEKLQRQQAETAAALAAENQQAGEAFLAENKMRQDVTTTESGLQYTVLQEGTGERPAADDTVQVHYRGLLLDGSVFDSSYERQEPALFKVEEVIPAWTEALQLMRPGGRYRLFVPPDLAYGEQGAGPLIGPNQTLIFEIELLGIENGQKEGPGGGGPGRERRIAPEIGPG
jgi:FKBP-type peptidyl-prolyl cis-trans isomerase FklB